MSYDAGAAVGYLDLDIKRWNEGLMRAEANLINFSKNVATQLKINTVAPIRAAVAEQARIQATARVAAAKEAQLMQKASIAEALVVTRGQVAQQKAIAIDGARAQSKATLMEAQHGYRLSEIEARKVAASQVSYFSRIRQAGTSAFNSIGTSMTRLRYGAQLVATTLVVAFGLVAWQLTKLLGGFAEFEQRMRKATSVTKYTEDEFRAMTKEAETAAKKWGTPARDTADAFLFLGRAGLTANQQLSAMPAITAASKAMLEDLEETAEGTVNVMNAFNISFSQTAHVTDMMTEAVNSSTMNLHEFLVSLSYAAKPAAAFNNTIEDTAAMIGIAANAGIRGSKAGTALRYSLTQLAAPTSGMKRLIRELNLTIYDTEGRMLPLVDILQEIADKTAGAGEQVRNYTLKTLFGQRALSTMIALFDKGAVGIRAYANQIRNAGNVTETTAQRQMLAMKSQLERLREAWEVLRRHIVQAFAPDVTRIVKVIITHVDDWTEAVDKNQKAVRSFMKELMGMMVTFTKIVAGAAGFAVLLRVLGGIVMILQAILSPLGAILAIIFTLQVAWKSNFLGMRDVASAVFEFLRNDALSFFSTLINGAWTAVSYVINQLARLGTKLDIRGLVGNITMAGTNRPAIGRLLGVNPAEEARRLLTLDRKFYEDMKNLALAGLPDEEYFKKLEQMIKDSQLAISEKTAMSTIQNILDTTKPATEVLGAFFADVGKAARETAMGDLNFFLDKIKGLMTPEMMAMWQKLKDLMNDIASGRAVGEAITTAPTTPGKPISTSRAYPGLDRGGVDFVRGYYGRLKVLYQAFLDAYTIDWNAAIKSVTEGFKTQQDVMIEMFQNIQMDWATALDNLMQKGSSFIDFMDSFFQSILAGFRRMVAEMLSIQMFETVFGRDSSGRTTKEAGAGLFGAVWSGLKYLSGASKGWGGGVTMPSGTTSESLLDLGDELESGRQKIVPNISLNVSNNGTPVSLRQVGKTAFDGKQIVVNYVMEEAVTNPRFREILAGGT